MGHSAKELSRLTVILHEARQELDLARRQSTKPQHLETRSQRAAVQAARAVAAAVDLGCNDIWPSGWWVLWALRKPDDPARPEATITIGDKVGRIRKYRVGSGCNNDGSLRDDTALALWKQQMCPALRSKAVALKAHAGCFDFPAAVKDASGHLLGRDGKPLEVIETLDPDTGVTVSKLDGKPAMETDTFDCDDAMEYLRSMAADWSDACEVAAERLRGGGDAADGVTAVMCPKAASLTEVGGQADEARWLVGELRDMSGIGRNRFTDYVKLAGCEPAGRGKKNHRYTDHDARKILECIRDNCTEKRIKTKCKEALENHF